MGERAIVLECAGAGVRYPEGSGSPSILALSDIDLRVRSGEMVAVLGREGSGTSTLCRLAAGLIGDRGTVTGTVLRGGDGGSKGRAAGPGPCAMLGDDPEAQLTGMTSIVDDEVRLPRRLHGFADGRAPAEALAALGVEHLAGRRLNTLSGGERQLVALAALMTLEPELLVLDQPSLSLDPDARGLLARALRRFCSSGGAVLLAGHQHDELSASADRIALLRDGRIARTLTRGEIAGASLEDHGVWTTTADGAGAYRRMPSDDSRDPELLRARDLSVSRGGCALFERIDLTLGAGRVTAVIGPNGVGKSSLLRGIAGLLDTDVRVHGEVLVDAERDPVTLLTLPPHLRARHVAWVGQDPAMQLSATTVWTELERGVPLPPHRRRDRARVRADRAREVDKILRIAGLADEAETHPFDLGVAQRRDLVIGSAMLLHPRVLLLDEPTLGRDLDSMRGLERMLDQFTGRGGAVMVTTHDLRWAESVAHEIVRLRASESQGPRSPGLRGSE